VMEYRKEATSGSDGAGEAAVDSADTTGVAAMKLDVVWCWRLMYGGTVLSFGGCPRRPGGARLCVAVKSQGGGQCRKLTQIQPALPYRSVEPAA